MTEKVIELQEVKSEKVEERQPISDIQIIDKKPVTKLSQEEKDIIIQCYKEGKEQPNYTVSESKTGKLKITKSKSETTKSLKEEPKVVDNKSIDDDNNKPKRAKSNDENEGSSMLTNEQMMILHMMDLNSKLDYLAHKQQKLKKKYKKMKNDIYVDDDSIDVDVNELEKKLEVSPNVSEVKKSEEITKVEISQPIPPKQRQVYSDPETIYRGKGWRQKVKFL